MCSLIAVYNAQVKETYLLW